MRKLIAAAAAAALFVLPACSSNDDTADTATPELCSETAEFDNTDIETAVSDVQLPDGAVFDGDQVAIDGEDVWYESLCATCYLEASGGRLG